MTDSVRPDKNQPQLQKERQTERLKRRLVCHAWLGSIKAVECRLRNRKFNFEVVKEVTMINQKNNSLFVWFPWDYFGARMISDTHAVGSYWAVVGLEKLICFPWQVIIVRERKIHLVNQILVMPSKLFSYLVIKLVWCADLFILINSGLRKPDKEITMRMFYRHWQRIRVEPSAYGRCLHHFSKNTSLTSLLSVDPHLWNNRISGRSNNGILPSSY